MFKFNCLLDLNVFFLTMTNVHLTKFKKKHIFFFNNKIIVVFLIMIFSNIGGDHFKLNVHTLCGFSFYCVWHDTNHVEILSTMFGMAAAQSCIICAGTCLLTSKIIWTMDTSCDLNTNNIIHEFMHCMAGFQIFVEGESKKQKSSSVWRILQNCFLKFWKITMGTLYTKKKIYF